MFCYFKFKNLPSFYTLELKIITFLFTDYDISCLQELSCDFGKFMNCSRNADIILRCGNTEIKAHKDVLCFRAQKFADMIEVKDNVQKMPAEKLDILTLGCMDPIVFVILIRYIYTATLPDLTSELAKKIYEAAHKYSIDSLKKRCAKFMIEHLCNVDAIEVLTFANDHNDDDMKWAVASYIASKLHILNSDEWKKFSETNQGLAVEVFRIFTERVNTGISPTRLSI